MVAVLGRPVIFISVIGLVNRVLGLIAARVDIREGLTQRGEYSSSVWNNLLFSLHTLAVSMQRFVAELSTPIDRAEFEKCWRADPSVHDNQTKVEFVFAGSRVSAAVHTESESPWASASFHSTFSAAIRRLDRRCNVRWL